VGGVWRDLTDSVNFMAGKLTAQAPNVAQGATADAQGDPSQKNTGDARRESLELQKNHKHQDNPLSPVSGPGNPRPPRLKRDDEDAKGVKGTWRDLTDSVNFMAGNLTAQVRNVAQVATAVAQGDLSQKITVDARGEILELKNTINTMVDQLSAFADEVTRVA